MSPRRGSGPAAAPDAARAVAQYTRVAGRCAIAIEREGGAELTEARHQVKAAEERLAAVQRAVDELGRLAAQAGLAAPEDIAGHADFLAAVTAAEHEQREAEQALRTRDFDAQSALAEARRELKAVEDELAAAGSRDSNVPIEDATLRARLAADLGLEATDLPYAAELLAVDEDAADWEAAAERLTRAFALSLLVPDQHYKRVAAWVDEHHLGRRLTYFQVPALAPVPVPARAGTMAACLNVRDGSPVTAWLRAEVNRRYDHALVTDAGDLAAHQRAVTKAGQVKDGTRHVKDDRQRADDRRYYVLGWDTAARRAVLLAALPEKRQAVEDAIKHSDAVGLARSGHGDRGYALRQIRERFTDPADVDLGTAVDALTDARDIYDLFANDADLARLMKEQEECEATIVRLQEEQSKLDRRLGAAADRRGSYQRAQEAAERQLAAVGAPALADDASDALAEALRAVGSEPATVERCDTWGRDVTAELHQRADSARATRDRSGQRLVGAMKDFASKWPEVVVDIPTADPAGRAEFLALRDRLERDDLPSYEQNFREQLETNAIHELVAFSNFLDREAKNITGRIETINGALADIDYRPVRLSTLVGAGATWSV